MINSFLSQIKGRKSVWSILPLFLLPFQLFPGQPSSSTPKNLSQFSIPSYFVRNQGQFETGVRYQFKVPSVNMWFYDNAVTYQFIKATNNTSDDHLSPSEVIIKIPNTTVYNLRLSFRNANPQSAYVESEPLASKSNYFIGNDQKQWTTDAVNFKSLIYKNIYDNIDVKFYDTKNILKNDYIIHPGGKLSDLKLTYEGAESVQLTEDGKLRLQTKEGLLFEHIPVAYQQIDGFTVPIDIRYSTSADNTIHFETSGFSPNYDLVIDPVLIYSTFLGGSGDDLFSFHGGFDRDAQGNIYISGRTGSSNFPTTPGAYDVTYNGGSYDVFALKLNPTGSALIYCTFLGGSGFDATSALKVIQSTHEVVITGVAGSSNFPVTAGAYQTSYAGGTYDVFVTKLNSAGNGLLFSTFVGSNNDNEGLGIDVDSTGNIYCIGQTQNGFPVTPGCYQPTFGGGSYNYDVFLFKMNPTGTSLLYSTYIGGTLIDRGYNIKVDLQGNAYISGTTQGNFPVTPGAFQTTYGGGTYDCFVAKLNPSGSALVYSTYLGGPGEDWVYDGFFLDEHHQVTISGYAGAGFPTTVGAYDRTFNGGTKDAFIARLNATGSALIFSTYFGGSGDDDAYALDVSANKDIFIAGLAGAGLPTSHGAYDTTYNGNGDAYLARFDSTASNLLYSTYIGGSGNDFANAVFDDGDSAYVVGTTVSSDFPVTAGAFDQTFNGGSHDIFALKLDQTTNSKVSGHVKYLNSVATPIDITKIIVKNQYNQDVDSTFTDTSGFYSFTFHSSGTYYFKPIIDKLPGGFNAEDALIALRHFVRLDTLSGLYYRAGDVNVSFYVNSVDAILILDRWAGLIDTFQAGDWVYDNEPVIITGAGQTHDINVLCVGDVNGSYIPPPCTPSPSAADAGPDQNVNGTSTILTGNTPLVGTGLWTILSGSGGLIANPANPQSAFSGNYGTYLLQWKISTVCGSSTSTVNITFFCSPQPTTANAGPNQNLNGNITSLFGNTPVNGTGLWTILSGTGGVISNPANPISLFSGNYGTYTLQWEIYTSCGSSTSTVNITFNCSPQPTTANAGPQQNVSGNSTTLAANTPSAGTGLWTIISGSGGLIADSTNPQSAFSGSYVTYILQWTITTICGSSSANVTIIFSPVPGLPCPGIPTVDYGGKTYNTVQVGSQCWLKENLDIGTQITNTDTATDNGIIEKYCYNNDPANCNIYGGLYQWDEMMQYTQTEGTQGICPSGWHIPTDAEWCILVNSQQPPAYNCTVHDSWTGGGLGLKFKEPGTTHWNVNTGATNVTGFTALGSGDYNTTTPAWERLKTDTWFQTSTQANTTASYNWAFNYVQQGINRRTTLKSFSTPVRCLMNY